MQDKNHDLKMSEEGQNPLVISEKRGVKIYAENPSISNTDGKGKPRKRMIGNERRGLVINDTGEILGYGSATLYEYEDADPTKFVKMYLGMIKKAAGMSKAGYQVFEALYHQMQKNHNTDQVILSYYIASQSIVGLNERTYQRGLRDLLDREILYRSPADGVFFVDINCMFNGDRLNFVKQVRLKKNEVQGELPLLPAPKTE